MIKKEGCEEVTPIQNERISLVCKIFVNEIIVANTGHSPPRHAREACPCEGRERASRRYGVLSGHRNATCPNIIDV
ncbi:MAG: hypothetical protein JRH06_18070 [Deltaproteobacteria bacterium]|nr:hypothetical protein [Deltaproteobacteria bacterium]